MKSGERGRVDGAAGAGAHDGRDLGNHAARNRVAQEDVGVAAERQDAFLDTGAAGIVEADHRDAGLEGQVHDLADLLGIGFRKRAAEHGEILGEDEHRPAGNLAVAGDEAVAVDDLLVHAKVTAAVADQLVHFFESAFVEKQLDAFPGAQLALFVLSLASGLAPSRFGGGMPASHFVQA